MLYGNKIRNTHTKHIEKEDDVGTTINQDWRKILGAISQKFNAQDDRMSQKINKQYAIMPEMPSQISFQFQNKEAHISSRLKQLQEKLTKHCEKILRLT